MIAMAFGAIPAQAVSVAAKLGIVDHLVDGPRSAGELARLTGTHAPSLYRVLRALATLEVLVEGADGRFASTTLGDTLRSDGPESVRRAVIMAGDPSFTRACGEMMHSVRTGTPAFDHVFGTPFFDYLARHTAAGAVFNGGMANLSELENPTLAAAYDFPAHACVIDVGGGRGGFLAEVLKAHPTVRGVLYDLPGVVREASVLREAGAAERCEVRSGDFFAAVPEGGDVYVVKRILHDWADEQCVRLLRSFRRAMPAHGRLLAVDAVLAPAGTRDFGTMPDLLMLVVSPGRERTEAEFRELFTAAGFRLARVISTPSSLAIVEGVPA